MLRNLSCIICIAWSFAVAGAEEFNVVDYGATPNDDADDTTAIQSALDACAEAGGGTVYIPRGTYIISRQASESPILQMESNTTVKGDGPVSVLKFDPGVNTTNFWRIIGARRGKIQHVTIRDLALDGSNTHPEYTGEYEQNHGIFFYAQREGEWIEHITIANVLAENFSGDAIHVGKGCKSVVIRNVSLRDHLRQGIQLAGGNGARDYLVTECVGLENSVKPAGSTIHVEHADGLTNVIISDNYCPHSLLATGVDGLIIRGNLVKRRIRVFDNRNLIIEGNFVDGRDITGGKNRPLIEIGYTDGAVIANNSVESNMDGLIGINVYGMTNRRDTPSRHVIVSNNLVRVHGPGIVIDGVEDSRIEGNLCFTEGQDYPIKVSRSLHIDTTQQAGVQEVDD